MSCLEEKAEFAALGIDTDAAIARISYRYEGII